MVFKVIRHGSHEIRISVFEDEDFEKFNYSIWEITKKNYSIWERSVIPRPELWDKTPIAKGELVKMIITTDYQYIRDKQEGYKTTVATRAKKTLNGMTGERLVIYLFSNNTAKIDLADYSGLTGFPQDFQ